MALNSNISNNSNKAKIHDSEDKIELLKNLIKVEKQDEAYLGEQLGMIFKVLANQITQLEKGLVNLSVDSKLSTHYFNAN